MEEAESNEEIIAEKMHDDEKKEMMKKKMKEDIDALFADDSTISEEFKSKVSTIFEARVQDRVTQIEEETEERYAGMLEEAVESIKQDLTEKVDDYLSYIVEQWMEENQIAIESGLRSEMTEDFIAGLRNLFAEHYIDVPAEKVDLVDELAGKVEELETKLNEEIERGVSFAKALVESRKKEIAGEVCEGLIATQVEKIKSLAESVEFSTEDEYKEKLETIRENYFPSGIKKASESQLQEEVTDGSEKQVVSNDPYVAAVANAISKTKI
jgi:membrane-associated HD superfamily phosphohydrolase